jgi:hypothetical protein
MQVSNACLPSLVSKHLPAEKLRCFLQHLPQSFLESSRPEILATGLNCTPAYL